MKRWYCVAYEVINRPHGKSWTCGGIYLKAESPEAARGAAIETLQHSGMGGELLLDKMPVEPKKPTAWHRVHSWVIEN